MKKILSVILGLALCCMLAALPVCAEETAAPVQAETAEIGDGYVTLVSDSNQLIPVYVDEEAEGAGGTVEQMMSDFSVGGTIMGLINDSGIYDIIKGNWKSAVMILISFVLLYLAIVKQFEPLLLMPIAFGMLLTNLPLAGIMDEPIYEIISNPTYHGKAGIPIYNGDMLVGYQYIKQNGGLLYYLYQGVKHIALENFIPKDGAFPVKGYSLDSQLHSVPDCQAIVKKAAVDRLGANYGLSWLPETGATYQIRFSIMKDRCEIFLDTSGVSLHKRGYRENANLAPLHETMAAAMVNLARYRGRDFFWDPFCGSGTICIEAAMIALNRAPGMNRSFGAQKWACVPQEVWREARTEALDKEYRGDYRILGTDIDPAALDIARDNARKAGVGKLIDFREADATKMSLPTDKGLMVCNPPYGERMLEQRSAQQLYRAFGRHVKFADGWKKYIISSEPEFEHYFGKQATKKRKLYNGRLQCNVYMYF